MKLVLLAEVMNLMDEALLAKLHNVTIKEWNFEIHLMEK